MPQTTPFSVTQSYFGPLSEILQASQLVYYSQGWHLVFDGEPLFDDPIEAWANGPVVPTLYQKHRGLFAVHEGTFESVGELTEFEKQTIDAVLASYGDLDAHQLSNLTHNEKPWIEARQDLPEGARSNVEISRATMLEYYQGVLNASQNG